MMEKMFRWNFTGKAIRHMMFKELAKQKLLMNNCVSKIFFFLIYRIDPFVRQTMINNGGKFTAKVRLANLTLAEL